MSGLLGASDLGLLTGYSYIVLPMVFHFLCDVSVHPVVRLLQLISKIFVFHHLNLHSNTTALDCDPS